MTLRIINPPGLGTPKGYAHGVRAGNLLFVSGQIGRRRPDSTGANPDVPGFVPQFEAALENVLTVVREAGGRPENLVELTIFVKNMDAYRAARPALAKVWRRLLDRHYPAITLVEVSDLFEKGTTVEIRAIAALE